MKSAGVNCISFAIYVPKRKAEVKVIILLKEFTFGEMKMPLPMMMPTMTLTALKSPRLCFRDTFACKTVAEVVESMDTFRSLTFKLS